MKIKVNKNFLKKVLKFKSNKFFKQKYILEIDSIIKYNKITMLHFFKKISGINNSTSFFLASKIGVSPFNTLNNSIKNKNFILKTLESLLKEYKIMVGNTVFIIKRTNISNLKKLQNYRGLRHSNSLPVRGQKTYSNASTRKKHRIA